MAAAALFGAFALFAAVSSLWAVDAGHALVEAIRVLGYAGLFVLVVLASARGEARSWLVGLGLGLVAIAALACMSRMLPSVFGEPVTAEFLQSARSRLSYPLGYWNALGAAMALAILLMAWLSAEGTSRLGRAAAGAALPIPVLGVFLTSSRGAVLGVAVGLVVMLAIADRRERLLAALLPGSIAGAGLILVALPQDAFLDADRGATASSQGRVMLLAALVAAALAGCARYLLDGPISRFRVPGRLQAGVAVVVALGLASAVVAVGPVDKLDSFKDASSLREAPQRGLVKSHITSTGGGGRYQFWKAAWQGFEHRPVAGLGEGGYESWWAQHGSISYYLRNAHSLPLETLAELGLIGALLLAGGFGVALFAGVRNRRPHRADVTAAAAVVAAGLACAAIDWTWQIAAAFAPVIVAAALLAGPALAGGRPLRSPFGWGLATLLFGWAALAVTAIVLASNGDLSQSRDAAKQGDLARASREARRAQALTPWSSEPRLQLALVAELDGDLKQAERQIDEAIDRAPDDWRLWLVAARIRSKAGDLARARAALATARDLNPRSPLLSPVRG
ncbi:MAG TPA: O-antigen ligase family protein [Thermoleophilaceae bacterium]